MSVLAVYYFIIIISSFDLIKSILTLLVKSNNITDIPFGRKDCYEAFSYPKLHIELFSYFPSNPNYIFISVNRTHNSYLFGFMTKIVAYDHHFKKIDGPCTNILKISSIGKDFLKMRLNINIFLYQNRYKIAEITYIISKDFKPGDFLLYDKYSNFVLRLEILDDLHDYNQTFIKLMDDFKSYFLSFSNISFEICLITNNNHVVVLTLSKRPSFTKGLLTGLMIELFHDGVLRSFVQYASYECNKTKNYDNEEVLFILHPFYDLNISFKGIYPILDDPYIVKAIKDFNFVNIKTLYADGSVIPKNGKKVFLLDKFNIAHLQDSEGSIHKIYKYNNNTIYYIEIDMKIKEFNGIQRYRTITHTPFDPYYLP